MRCVGLVLALFGVSLTLVTGNGVFDALGTACIGVLLVLIAIVLAMETKSLLLGESATAEHVEAIGKAITRDGGQADPPQDPAPGARGNPGRGEGVRGGKLDR